MKKSYVKPSLFMESFEMAEHIARCGINHSGAENNEWGFKAYFHENDCHATIFEGAATIFASMAACGMEIDDSSFLGGCYHGNESDDQTVFGS